MVMKVMSGGQTGVDRAALETARAAGLPIGGWCPSGRLAEDGPISLDLPLRETESSEYAERTERNVRDSDGTLVLVREEPSGGTALTIELAQQHRRPCRVVRLTPDMSVEPIAQWLGEQRIQVLNVAGPRESTSAGISEAAAEALSRLWRTMQAPGLARRQDRLARFKQADLYPVTCEALSNGRSDEEVLRACIAGGAKLIQLRDKTATKGELLRKAERFRELTARHGLLLIINDHLDIAQAVDADGVHLGQDDFPVRLARHLIPDKLIGASTHSLAEARQAEADGADTINIGPIFSTKTKEGISGFLGPSIIGQIVPHVSLPFTVMGGIKAHNLPEVLAAGAQIAAVVTAVTKADDMAAAVRELRQIILDQRGPRPS